MRATLVLSGSLLGFALAAAPACDPKAGDDCQRGTESCSCTADFRCLEGLSCLSEYCVDLDWEPDLNANDDDDNADADEDEGSSEDEDEGEEEGGDEEGGDEEGGSGAADNVGACEAWIDAAECGDFDWSDSVDCSLYANLACDIADYFNCLTDNTSCTDGIPDTSGWTACYDLATCA